MRIEDIVFVYQLKTPELVRWHSRRHSHRDHEFELHYFVGGHGHFDKEHTRYTISPGTLHFSPPKEVHWIQPGDIRRPLSYYAVLFSAQPGTALREMLNRRSYESTFPRRVGARYRVVFEDLKNRYTHHHEARRRSAHHLLQSLLWDFAAEVGSGDDTETAHTGQSDYNIHIQRALTVFDNHLRGRLTIGDVAERLGITQAHLTRLFTDHFGVSPLQYYQRMRMDVAASLLLNTTQSIKEIAWELGYANPFHFSRSFRRYADMGPREYREQYYLRNPTEYAARIIKT